MIGKQEWPTGSAAKVIRNMQERKPSEPETSSAQLPAQTSSEASQEAFLLPFTGSEEVLRSVVEPALATMRLELVQLTLVRGKTHDVLRLFVDKFVRPGAAQTVAVSLADLERANRVLSDLLDVEDQERGLFSHAYDLEVSSPGLDRPLTKKSHFAQAVGKRVKIRTQSLLPTGGRGGTGVLASVDDDGVVLDVEGSDSIRIGFANIAQAHVVFVFEERNKKKVRPVTKTPTGSKKADRKKEMEV